MLAKKNLWRFEDQNTFFLWWLHLLNLDNVNVNVLVRLIVTTALYLSHVVCFWAPALAELSYEFGAVRLSVCSRRKIPELAHHFFLILCMKLAIKYEN